MQGSGFRRYRAYGLGLGIVSTGCSKTEILSTGAWATGEGFRIRKTRMGRPYPYNRGLGLQALELMLTKAGTHQSPRINGSPGSVPKKSQLLGGKNHG